MRRGVLVALLAAVVVATGGWLFLRGSSSLSVTPPQERPAGTLPEAPVSAISIPVSVTVQELQDLARTRIPEETSGSDSVRESLFDGRGTYLVQKDGEPIVRVEEGRLLLSVPVTFRARLNGMAKALGFAVPVSLSATGAADVELSMKPSISSDWKVHTQSRIRLAWRTAPAARVLGTRVTFKGAAEAFLRSRIEDALPRIDEALNDSLELRDRAEEAWREIQEPVKVSDSPDLWLSASPVSVTLPPLDLHSDRVVLEARLDTRLALDTRKPGKASPAGLPPVSTGAGEAKASGFTLQLPVFLGYEAVNRELGQRLSGHRVPMGQGRTVTIEKIAVSPNGDRLVLAVAIRAVEGAGIFSSRKAGTIYVTGIPKWDKSRQVVRLDRLDYDEGTTRGLLRTAAWVARPLLLEKLKEASVFPLAEPAEEARKALSGLLEKREVGSGLAFGGSARQVALESVAVTEEGLALLVRAEGTASLQWSPGSR